MRRDAFHDVLVDLEQLRGNALPGVALSHELASGGAAALPQRLVGEHVDDRGRERVVVAGRTSTPMSGSTTAR